MGAGAVPPERIIGWHAETKGPVEPGGGGRELYLSHDEETASVWAEGEGSRAPVHRVEYEARDPLHVRDGAQIRALWEEVLRRSGGSFPTGSFHPHATGAFADLARERGHDAVVIHPEAVAQGEAEDDDDAYEWGASTFGEPQTLILDPGRAKFGTTAMAVEDAPLESHPTGEKRYEPQPIPDPLPIENGLYWRVHPKGRPLDTENAHTAPHIHEDILKARGEDIGHWRRPGYSAFWNPHHVAEYAEAMGWENRGDEEDTVGENETEVIGFRGHAVGEGYDGEPAVMPHSETPEHRMTWQRFKDRLDFTPHGYGSWHEHHWSDQPDPEKLKHAHLEGGTDPEDEDSDDPEVHHPVLYHATPTSNRESILRDGLHRDSFAFDDLDFAKSFAPDVSEIKGGITIHTPYDIWEVQAGEYTQHPDDRWAGVEGKHNESAHILPEGVHPADLKLVHTTSPDEVTGMPWRESTSRDVESWYHDEWLPANRSRLPEDFPFAHCHETVDALDGDLQRAFPDHGWERDAGDIGGGVADHSWFVDEGGNIFDPTHGQFASMRGEARDPERPGRIVRPEDPEYADYGWEAEDDPEYMEEVGHRYKGKPSGERRTEYRSSREASYDDVRAKAKRLYDDGAVAIVVLEEDVITSSVRGDHGAYDVEIQRVYKGPKFSESVTQWLCTCPWSTYAWGRQPRFKKLEGRMCSHALATLYEAHSQENRADSPFYRGPPQKRKTAADDLDWSWFHISDRGNRDSITREGLLPQFGATGVWVTRDPDQWVESEKDDVWRVGIPARPSSARTLRTWSGATSTSRDRSRPTACGCMGRPSRPP